MKKKPFYFQYNEEDLTCDNVLESFKYVIGKNTGNLTVVYTNNQNRGVPTALHATFQDDNLVVLVGTSGGQLVLVITIDQEIKKYWFPLPRLPRFYTLIQQRAIVS